MAITIRSATAGFTGGANPVTVVTAETSATQVGDLVVVIQCNGFYTFATLTTPTATGSPVLTAITGGSVDGGTDQAHVKSYTYVANTNGAQTITATHSGEGLEEKCLAAYVLAGADITTPIDVAAGTFSATSVNLWTLDSISPATSDALLIAHANRGATSSVDTALTSPGSMTERYNTGIGATSPNAAGATQQLSASGATGTRSFDPTLGDRPFGGLMIAIRTATVVVVPNIRIMSAARRLP